MARYVYLVTTGDEDLWVKGGQFQQLAGDPKDTPFAYQQNRPSLAKAREEWVKLVFERLALPDPWYNEPIILKFDAKFPYKYHGVVKV